MTKITLYRELDSTSVPNIFIDQYMTQANGEYVKIYLYLLRCIHRPAQDFSLSHIADHFECTERDVARALAYWEKQRLFHLEYDGQRNLTGIYVINQPGENVPDRHSSTASAASVVASENAFPETSTGASGTPSCETSAAVSGTPSSEISVSASGNSSAKPSSTSSGNSPAEPSTPFTQGQESSRENITNRFIQASTQKPAHATMPAASKTAAVSQTATTSQTPPAYSMDTLQSFCQDNDVREMVFIAEQYLQRTINQKDLSTIFFWYDELHFPADLIIFIIENCVNKGHTSLNYMQRIAEDLAARQVRTVEEAKLLMNRDSEIYHAVIKSFGITGRNLNPSENSCLRTWSEKFGFGAELIAEACNRTINNIHKPSFSYAHSILENWHKNHIHTLEEVEKADEAHQQAQQNKRPGSATGSSPSRQNFNNFEQRDNNYSDLQKKLIQSSFQ